MNEGNIANLGGKNRNFHGRVELHESNYWRYWKGIEWGTRGKNLGGEMKLAGIVRKTFSKLAGLFA